MNDPSNHIQQIYVNRDVHSLPYCQEILRRAGNIRVETIDGDTPPGLEQQPYPQSLHQGKKVLLLTKNKGAFLKPCPGTREYRCCDYQVINIGMNCPMDCVYCILQAYLNNPWLSFFVNIDELFADLRQKLDAQSDVFLRIGTGEFTDSMALDRLTGLSRHLVNFMAKEKNAVLELKTKSAAIDNLQGLDHNRRTVVAWSLNSPAIMQKEELRTATLEERLDAAARCADWGYRLAFHFDPIILHQDWETGYRRTIELLFRKVPREQIAWISMGALRYLPHLKKIACSRFPKTRFFAEEFVLGLDNKMRYFRGTRTEMYKQLFRELQKHVHERTCIYLCMENDEIWRDVFGYAPEEKGGLRAMLDRAVNAS